MGKIVSASIGTTLMVLVLAFQGQTTNQDSESLLKEIITKRGISNEEGYRDVFKEVYGYDLENHQVGNLPIITGGGGPDSFGYTFSHCSFSFVSLQDSTVDTTVSERELGDDNFFDLPLPFTFPFYGQNVDTIRVASNGYLTVPPNSGTVFANTCPIPTGAGPENVIAVFWDDLWGLGGPADREIRFTHRTGGSVDSTIIQYNKFGFFLDIGQKRNTFQVILESTGCITFNYLNVDSTISIGPHSATAGIENSAGTVALSVACNQPDGNGHIKDSTSICICPPITIVPVEFDIKPQSCPNPLNTKANGVLPVAILGTDSFDVTDIVVSTVRLEGVAPIRSALEDVSRPVLNRRTECHCITDPGEGFMDLTLKFDKQSIVAALGAVNDGDSIVLTITGELENGDFFEGQDCVLIRKKADNRGGEDALASGPSLDPTRIVLYQNEPNPVSSRTTILYSLPLTGHLSLELFDLSGRLIRTLKEGVEEAGIYSVEWDGMDDSGKSVTNGIYFYRLVSRGIDARSSLSVTQKLIVLRY